jgi:hypothetical protein
MEKHNKIAPPMGSQTTQTLKDIKTTLDALSATAWLISESRFAGESSESAIESVSRDLSYRIAEQAEKLEAIINGGAA